jgi:Protein of unknown function, DUF600
MTRDERSMVGMAKDDRLHELWAMLVRDEGLVRDDWQTLALISRIEADTPDLSGVCYDAEGAGRPVAPRNFDVFGCLEALRSRMAQDDGGEPWQACSIRIERNGKIKVDFEYE